MPDDVTAPAGAPEKMGTAIGVIVLCFVYLGILWMMARAVRIV